MKKQTIIREISMLSNSYVLSNKIRNILKEALSMLKNQDNLIEELENQKKENKQLKAELSNLREFYNYGCKMGYNKPVGDYPNDIFNNSDIYKLCPNPVEAEALDNPLIGIEGDN